MDIRIGHADMAERLRQVIKDDFGTQIALAKAIGVKDGSYLTPYVTGRSMIGSILRKKLEGVGIDVDYVMTGRKQDLASGQEADGNTLLIEQCAEKLLDLQGKLLALHADVLEIHQMLGRLKQPNNS